MRILQDTHILLWALAEPERLGRRTRASLEDPANEIQFSAASIWEIAIKAALGRPDFSIDPDEIFKAAVTTGFVEMPVRAQAAMAVARLPAHHRDPFDRLLVAQAMTEPARLYTADLQLRPYSELVVLVS